jgi:Tfp pilus assembly protein PilF
MGTLDDALARGVEHHQAGRLAQAESIYREILRVEPGHGEALQLLGTLRLQLGRPEEAIALLEQSVAVAGGNAAVFSNLGSACLAAGRNEQARAALERAVACEPNFGQAHYNLGMAQSNLGLLAESAISYRRCLEREPGMAAAHNNLGDVLRQLGQLDTALVHCSRAVELDPRMATAHYNRALILLSMGHLAEGWAEYEWRGQCPGLRARSFAQPQWTGQPLGGTTLLLHGEQGLGDTLQFIRFVPQVRERCRRVVVEVQAPLAPLLRASGFDVLAAGEYLPTFDVHLPLMSVPGVLGVHLENIPAQVPYLTADPTLFEHWRQRLLGYTGLRVGIAWQGRPTYREDRQRSIPLAQFAPLAQVPGVTLLGLQKGPGREQIPLVQSQFSVVDLGSAADVAAGPFIDTAAIVRNLDLVVTSDTALAHLAGGLGVPVWLGLGFAPDWRWLTGRADSPWYPTMRLFRQPSPGDWPSVFRNMARALTDWNNSR